MPFENFARDFGAAMSAEGDQDSDLEQTMLGEDIGGDVAIAAAVAAHAAAVAAHAAEGGAGVPHPSRLLHRMLLSVLVALFAFANCTRISTATSRIFVFVRSCT